MAELDGTWEVRRTGGLLPPLVGVRKRIEGTAGSTVVLRGPGAPFDVAGLELRYRAPLAGLVDVLEPEGDGYRGRATYRGRTIGTFELVRAEPEPERAPADELVRHLDEAFALEQEALRLLDGLLPGVDDPELRRTLERHRTETEEHAELVRGRLAAHGASPSTVRRLGGILGALAKLPLDALRGEQTARAARDAYATEHLEIASYELLKRVARRAGDDDTVAACDAILEQERAAAEALAASWDAVAG